MLNLVKTNNNQPKFQEIIKDDITKQIDSYDKRMLGYLANLYESMNGEKLDLANVKNTVDALQQFNAKSQYKYLNDLLHPECAKGTKIPSAIPIPSCSFQLHNCVTLSTNASGNLALVFNPYFLANGTNTTLNFPMSDEETMLNYRWLTSLYVNNDVSLTGSGYSNHFEPVNIGQQIPEVYDQYRLVSASIVIKYIGRLDIASGVIGGAIVFDEMNPIGGYATTQIDTTQYTKVLHNQYLGKYGNFDLAMDSFYHQENLCLEGLRMLYFPLDNSYEEYTKLIGPSIISGKSFTFDDNGEIRTDYGLTADPDYYRNGFQQMVYVLGAPANSACFKCDIYCNFECLPNAKFLNYMPLSLSVSNISSQEKKESIAIVQKKPVLKLNEENQIQPYKGGSFWNTMIKKFGNKLPGIGKMIANGLISAIPALKSGLALAGTLISSNNEVAMQEEDVD